MLGILRKLGITDGPDIKDSWKDAEADATIFAAETITFRRDDEMYDLTEVSSVLKIAYIEALFRECAAPDIKTIRKCIIEMSDGVAKFYEQIDERIHHNYEKEKEPAAKYLDHISSLFYALRIYAPDGNNGEPEQHFSNLMRLNDVMQALDIVNLRISDDNKKMAYIYREKKENTEERGLIVQKAREASF